MKSSENSVRSSIGEGQIDLIGSEGSSNSRPWVMNAGLPSHPIPFNL